MSYLIKDLTPPLPYAYHIAERSTEIRELVTNDLYHRLGINENFYKPSYAYADFARVMTKQELQMLQDSLDYPVVYTPEKDDIKFSLDSTLRQVDTYIVVPIVAMTDISSLRHYYYKLTEESTEEKLIPMFWEDSDFETLKGSELSGNDKETFTPDLDSSKSNPGIFYIAYRYFGPKVGDADFENKYWNANGSFPILLAKYDTGGGSSQTVELGESFTFGSNENQSLFSYVKLSILEEVSGKREIVGHKTCDIDVTTAKTVYLRVLLTRPLSEDFTFDISYNPVLKLNSDIAEDSNLTLLQDSFGVEAARFRQYSSKHAESAVHGTDISGALTGTIVAGQTEIQIPITLTSKNHRLFSEIVLFNYSTRSNLKIMNNNILLSYSKGNLDEDFGNQGIYCELEVFENGRSIAEFNLGQTGSMDVDSRRVYEVEVTMTCLDVKAAYLRAISNQPIQSVFENIKRHLFLNLTLENDQGVQLFDTITMLTGGKPDVFVAGSQKQKFRFPLNLKTYDTEITLSLGNQIIPFFNGRTEIGSFTGFSFRKNN